MPLLNDKFNSSAGQGALNDSGFHNFFSFLCFGHSFSSSLVDRIDQTIEQIDMTIERQLIEIAMMQLVSSVIGHCSFLVIDLDILIVFFFGDLPAGIYSKDT